VIVNGRLKSRSFETREGERRTVFEIDADEVGPSLRNATAKVNKVSRSGGQGGSSFGGNAPAGRDTPASGGTDDPWASSTPQGGGNRPAGGDAWNTGGGVSDEPPF